MKRARPRAVVEHAREQDPVLRIEPGDEKTAERSVDEEPLQLRVVEPGHAAALAGDAKRVEPPTRQGADIPADDMLHIVAVVALGHAEDRWRHPLGPQWRGAGPHILHVIRDEVAVHGVRTEPIAQEIPRHLQHGEAAASPGAERGFEPVELHALVAADRAQPEQSAVGGSDLPGPPEDPLEPGAV